METQAASGAEREAGLGAGRSAESVADVDADAERDADVDAERDADVDAERDANLDAERDADARALASTVRMRILRLCLDRSLTNREIAQALGKNPATVLHHVRTLTDRGFLRAEPVRRGARGSREVPYRATGKSWKAPRSPGQAQVLLDTFLEEVALVPLDSVAASRLGLRLDEEGLAELHDRLGTVLEDFAARQPTAGGRPVSVFLAIHDDVTRSALGEI